MVHFSDPMAYEWENKSFLNVDDNHLDHITLTTLMSPFSFTLTCHKCLKDNGQADYLAGWFVGPQPMHYTSIPACNKECVSVSW